MSMNELELFLQEWDREAEGTVKLLRALPQSETTYGRIRGAVVRRAGRHLAEGERTCPSVLKTAA